MKRMIQKIVNKFNYKITKCYPRGAVNYLKGLNKKDLICIEIGVFRGKHAESILKELDVKKLYLIDLWEDYKEYFGMPNSEGLMDLKECEDYVRGKFERYENIKIIKGFSHKVIEQIKEKVDFIYLDANHDYNYVKRDIELYYNLLKSGGVIAGHDIENGIHKSIEGVLEAVKEFANKENKVFFIHAGDWWIEK